MARRGDVIVDPAMGTPRRFRTTAGQSRGSLLVSVGAEHDRRDPGPAEAHWRAADAGSVSGGRVRPQTGVVELNNHRACVSDPRGRSMRTSIGTVATASLAVGGQPEDIRSHWR